MHFGKIKFSWRQRRKIFYIIACMVSINIIGQNICILLDWADFTLAACNACRDDVN